MVEIPTLPVNDGLAIGAALVMPYPLSVVGLLETLAKVIPVIKELGLVAL